MKVLLCSLLISMPATLVVAQVDPLLEIGANDFRISFQQGTGDPEFDASNPAVAYNPTANEYLVVWDGLRKLPFPTCPQDSPPEREIWRLRIDATTGEPIGSAGTISQSGPLCDNTHAAFIPEIAYNATDNEYLVVWFGDDDQGGLANDEFEIFGQLLDGVGTPTGSDDFRISDMGGTGSTFFPALDPQVVWNATAAEYLVVWWGVDDNGLSFEIYGQRLDSNGAGQGANDFQISEVSDVPSSYVDRGPGLSWNGMSNEYLVVWSATDPDAGLVVNEREVFGQRLDANGGQLGDNDFILSDAGGIGSSSHIANFPAVASSASDNENLVVWFGTDDQGGLSNNENEVFGQRVDSMGGEPGPNDFRISDMGGTGDNGFGAFNPVVVWNATAAEYLVAWQGDDAEDGQVDQELEIFVQRVSSAGGELGSNDLRISDMGGIGNNAYDARDPAIAWNSNANQYLVVWEGDDNTGGLVDDEFEIFGQLLGFEAIFADGFESGDVSSWTGTAP